MRTIKKVKMRVVASSDPVEFQNDFNKAMEELAEYDPECELKEVGGGMWAIITWTVREDVFDSVKDEFHAEGIRYICDQCPYHDEVTDRRVKRIGCRYSEFGETHREHECCEYFYKMLKQGEVDAPTRTIMEKVMRKGGL